MSAQGKLPVPFRRRGIIRNCIVCGVEYAPTRDNQETCGGADCRLYVRAAKAQLKRDAARAERETAS